jgi:hypothetical protein
MMAIFGAATTIFVQANPPQPAPFRSFASAVFVVFSASAAVSFPKSTVQK